MFRIPSLSSSSGFEAGINRINWVPNHIHISTPRTRTEMVFKTSFFTIEQFDPADSPRGLLAACVGKCIVINNEMGIKANEVCRIKMNGYKNT